MMNTQEGTQVNVLEVYKAFTPMIASQLLGAYYTFLSHCRTQGDKRSDEEIFKDVLSDFLTVSTLVEKSIDSLDQLDKEQLLVQLKTLKPKE
jgi:hypothetical protein